MCCPARLVHQHAGPAFRGLTADSPGSLAPADCHNACFLVIDGHCSSDLLLNCHLICITVQINDLSNERSFFTKSLGAP